MDDKQRVPKKGDFIVNPSTSRPIRVGSRTWLELVKKGLVSGHYSDPRELAVIEDGEDVEQKINEINKTLPRNTQGVRGRGKYKGKIVSRNTQPSSEEISRYAAQIAARTVNNNIDELAEADDLEDMLEKMIMREMLTVPVMRRSLNKRTVGRPAKTQEYDDNKYQVEDVPEYEDDDDDDENDYQFDENDFE